jgi:hypothetical protein
MGRAEEARVKPSALNPPSAMLAYLRRGVLKLPPRAMVPDAESCPHRPLHAIGARHQHGLVRLLPKAALSGALYGPLRFRLALTVPAQPAARYAVGVGAMVRKVESFLLFTPSYAVVITFVVAACI